MTSSKESLALRRTIHGTRLKTNIASTEQKKLAATQKQIRRLERSCDSQYRQAVAGLVAQAQNGYKAEHGSHGDQESFVLTIHGTQVRLVAAYFTAEYLGYLESAEMPVGQHLYVRRSRFFEMKDPKDRKEALKMVIGLVEYLLSGYAAIEQIRGVAVKLKKGRLGKSRKGKGNK